MGYTSLSRRQFLRCTPVAALSFAGCLSASTPATETTQTAQTTKATQTTAKSVDASSLAAHASVVSQGTAAHPPIVQLGVTNTGIEPVPLRPYHTSNSAAVLEYSSELDGATGKLTLYPTSPEHLFTTNGELAESQTDGCWRFLTTDGETPRVAWESIAVQLELAPSESHSVKHALYTTGQDGPCYPAGEYQTYYRVSLSELDSAGPTKLLTYTLSLDDSGTVSIGAVEPTE
ncbi:hypothetical protein [Haladaptatus sp. ZSTT2]|uniref:hypothetical protein n=1 Tax=Haladaptatus sp. ZSTT2 TaxID=3120515 RepID=UPI00300EC312